MKKILLGLLILVLLPLSVSAQEAESFPTVDALNTAVVPPRDLVDLAKRLKGVTEIAPPPVNPPVLEVGAVSTFWVDNSAEDRSFEVEAELVVVGEYIYLWVEKGEDLPVEDLQKLADEFDALVYQQVRELWGSEANPGVDGDPRVHGLFVRDLGAGVGAYFASKHANPVEAVPTSSEREMFFYNLDAVEGLIGDFALTSITAHEFQHMISSNVDPNEDGWLDEGLSQFTQVYLGDPSVFTVLAFQNNPNTQLNTWTEDGNRTADYGASQLWVMYLHERFGIEGLNALSADPANGMVGVDNLARANGTTVNDVFADWVVANWILDPQDTEEGIYGYTDAVGLTTPRATTYDVLPFETELSVNQYAANYTAITNLNGVDTLNISVTAPNTSSLAPMQSPSNTPMWYSNRGDDSDTRLTFPVDLATAQNPVLTFDLWYHIETNWDYGYLMASTDGGITWDILQTDEMTTENPHFTAFGSGYTGESGGGADSVWITETVSLSDYAGQEILLRYEMIYDDAVNQEGMFIDFVTVTDDNTIVYTTDFSNGASDWLAEGWVLTDNRLPQQVWVQTIQQKADDAIVTRWLLNGGTGEYALEVADGVDSVIIVLAPFAPKTTVSASLQLNVTR